MGGSKQAQIKPRKTSQEVQTEAATVQSSLSQTDITEQTSSSTQTDAPSSSSTASLNSKTVSKSSSSISTTGMSPEMTQLKTRIDNLILEKNSLRVRNEELSQDLEAANRKLENALANQPPQVIYKYLVD